MIRDRISVFSAILVISFFIFGCATDRVAFEVVDYANQGILRIADLEKRSLEQYASVIGDNYTADQRVYEELRDYVIPLYKRFLDGLREIRPEDEEIRRVHGIYIRAAESLYGGFKTKMLGIEMKNESLISAANEKIEEGREGNKRWRLALIELYKKYGVGEIKEKDKEAER